jgi:hypothetical protein
MPYKDPLKQKAAYKAWYERNKEQFLETRRDRRGKVRKFITGYKEENSTCMDCKISYPPHILQFDHVDGKSFNISSTDVRDKSIDEILNEISKCEIVCANCHAHRTWMRHKR